MAPGGAWVPLVVPGGLRLCVRPKKIEQPFGLGKRQSFDIGMRPPPEVEGGVPGLRVRAYRGMQNARGLGEVGDRSKAAPYLACAVVGGVVLDAQSLNAGSDIGRQGFERPIHIQEPGAAARRGCLQCKKHTRADRYLMIRVVGMPNDFAITQTAQAYSIVDDV